MKSSLSIFVFFFVLIHIKDIDCRCTFVRVTPAEGVHCLTNSDCASVPNLYCEYGFCKCLNTAWSKLNNTCMECQYGKYGNTCYYVQTSYPLPWINAKLACEDMGGRLATVKTEKEFNDLILILQNMYNNYNGYYWIGGGDVDCNGLSYWLTGTAVNESLNWFLYNYVDSFEFSTGFCMQASNANYKLSYADCNPYISVKPYICEF